MSKSPLISTMSLVFVPSLRCVSKMCPLKNKKKEPLGRNLSWLRFRMYMVWNAQRCGQHVCMTLVMIEHPALQFKERCDSAMPCATVQLKFLRHAPEISVKWIYWTQLESASSEHLQWISHGSGQIWQAGATFHRMAQAFHQLLPSGLATNNIPPKYSWTSCQHWIKTFHRRPNVSHFPYRPHLLNPYFPQGCTTANQIWELSPNLGIGPSSPP
jgi:hypothetical protein